MAAAQQKIVSRITKIIEGAYPARIGSLVAMVASIFAFTLILSTTIDVYPFVKEIFSDFKIAPTLIVAVGAIYATVAAVAWDYVTTLRRKRLENRESLLRNAPFFEEAKNIAIDGDALVTMDSGSSKDAMVFTGTHQGKIIRMVIISDHGFRPRRALLLSQDLDVVEMRDESGSARRIPRKTHSSKAKQAKST